MSERNEKSPSSITELVAWCAAAPILSFWALVSLLPIVSLIRAWGDFGAALVALAFLATGAVGFAAFVVGYRWLVWDETAIRSTSCEKRTLRVVAITAYALVWMALYAL